MRDIHVGKEDQRQHDKLRQTVRFEQEAPRSSASASSDPLVALEFLASGETQSRPVSVLVTTYKFLRWMHSMRWMDERVVTSGKCWNCIEERMHEISREVT